MESPEVESIIEAPRASPKGWSSLEESSTIRAVLSMMSSQCEYDRAPEAVARIYEPYFFNNTLVQRSLHRGGDLDPHPPLHVGIAAHRLR